MQSAGRLLIIPALAALAALAPAPAAQAEPAPKLALLIVVDQLRPDRLSADLPGGLGRLVREGFVYSAASLDHALTSTCPGHVVASTGVNPSRAGIAGNSYIDRDAWEERYCVHDAEVGRSPRVMQVKALGDWLKAESPASRVFSVSGKDRAAITLGGRAPDGVYWFDREAGRFATSAYYERQSPAYLAAFNGKDFFQDGYGGAFPEEWRHGPGALRPDDFPGESGEVSRSSPHPLNTGAARAEQVYVSPWVDDATLALGMQILLAEGLGQGDAPDLLALGFSATDTVGHAYGPYSAESEATLQQLDANLGEFFKLLDSRLGKGAYLVALTADHGVLPLPEWLESINQLDCPVPGGRLATLPLLLQTYWQTYWRFTAPLSSPSSLVKLTQGGLAVNHARAAELELEVEEIVQSLKAFFEAQPGIRKAWTVKDIMSGKSDTAALYRNSYVPGRSGDLFLEVHASCLAWYYDTGTSHGSPHAYDREVPLVFYGAGIAPGSSDEPVHTVDLAPTLAARLGLPIPRKLDGRVLDL